PEPALCELIRASDGFVPDLSLVAEDRDGGIVGHILLSHVGIAGSPDPVLALAPMAVVPERQRQGIGSALTRAALDAAEARDEPLVIVLGHPWFYPRFGFAAASLFGDFPAAATRRAPPPTVPARWHPDPPRGVRTEEGQGVPGGRGDAGHSREVVPAHRRHRQPRRGAAHRPRQRRARGSRHSLPDRRAAL